MTGGFPVMEKMTAFMICCGLFAAEASAAASGPSTEEAIRGPMQCARQATDGMPSFAVLRAASTAALALAQAVLLAADARPSSMVSSKPRETLSSITR